jgi:hypothetical protein
MNEQQLERHADPDGMHGAVPCLSVSVKQTAFSVVLSDYPLDHVQRVGSASLLDGARDGAVANTQGKLLSELIIGIAGNPGRELKISAAGGKGTGRAKLVLVGNRLYQESFRLL